jgi:hypothetical protein
VPGTYVDYVSGTNNGRTLTLVLNSGGTATLTDSNSNYNYNYNYSNNGYNNGYCTSNNSYSNGYNTSYYNNGYCNNGYNNGQSTSVESGYWSVDRYNQVTVTLTGNGSQTYSPAHTLVFTQTGSSLVASQYNSSWYGTSQLTFQSTSYQSGNTTTNNNYSYSYTNGNTTGNSNDVNSVRSVVESFVQHEQQNSTFNNSNSWNSISNAYSSYVTPSLLSSWESNPQSAPGRTSSYMTPDHIDITSIQQTSTGYEVRGNVISVMTNQGYSNSNTSQPVTIDLVYMNGQWLISQYQQWI